MARKITTTTCHEHSAVVAVEASGVKCGAGDHETGHSNDEEMTTGQAEILIQPRTLLAAAAMSGGASGSAAVTSMVPVNGTNNGGRDMI